MTLYMIFVWFRYRNANRAKDDGWGKKNVRSSTIAFEKLTKIIFWSRNNFRDRCVHEWMIRFFFFLSLMFAVCFESKIPITLINIIFSHEYHFTHIIIFILYYYYYYIFMHLFLLLRLFTKILHRFCYSTFSSDSPEQKHHTKLKQTIFVCVCVERGFVFVVADILHEILNLNDVQSIHWSILWLLYSWKRRIIIVIVL